MPIEHAAPEAARMALLPLLTGLAGSPAERTARLLERVAQHADAEVLRASLLELGARYAANAPRVAGVRIEVVERCPSCGQHAPVAR